MANLSQCKSYPNKKQKRLLCNDIIRITDVCSINAKIASLYLELKLLLYNPLYAKIIQYFHRLLSKLYCIIAVISNEHHCGLSFEIQVSIRVNADTYPKWL